MLGPLLGLLVAATLGAAFVPIPYYSLAPGSVRPTETLISIADDELIYASDGEVLFTTVSLKQVTLLEAFRGWLDPAVKVVPKDEILLGRDADDNREIGLQLMDTSKQAAIAVAFEHLGFDVVSGTGASVVEVVPDSPADAALETGDVVIAVDGETVELSDDLAAAVRDRSPGAAVTLSVEDGEGTERDVSVTLAASEQDEDRAFLGVQMETRDMAFELPFAIEIESGSVGGPSAGLAFALAVLDLLTPGELTGGEPVAVTGTINVAGLVGPVGGAAQKAVAVRRAGIDVFLVPSSEYEQALAAVGDDIRGEPIDNLDEALAVLADLGGNALALEAPTVEAA